jgi:hypothetical protein
MQQEQQQQQKQQQCRRLWLKVGHEAVVCTAPMAPTAHHKLHTKAFTALGTLPHAMAGQDAAWHGVQHAQTRTSATRSCCCTQFAMDGAQCVVDGAACRAAEYPQPKIWQQPQQLFDVRSHDVLAYPILALHACGGVVRQDAVQVEKQQQPPINGRLHSRWISGIQLSS